MVPAALSAREEYAGDWICLECEETDQSESLQRDPHGVGARLR
jgi:hypothetical protein